MTDTTEVVPWPRWTLPGAVGVLVVAAVVLLSMGRSPWCSCGSAVPWSWDTWGVHNSQHILDPYTFTHILHGVMFYGILWLGLKWWTNNKQRLVLAMAMEAGWEMIENTNAVIDQYRDAGVDYYGDSVGNSIADILWCTLGYGIAMSIPWWGSAIFFALTELALLWWIRDSLILNIILLTYPIDAISEWQGSTASQPPAPIEAPATPED